MPLFRVLIESEVVVQAESEDAAYDVARDIDAHDLPPIRDWRMTVCDEIHSLSNLPPEWDGECIAHGQEDDARLRELLKP